MSAMAYQFTSLTIVYSTVYSGADQRKHQSFASLAFVRGIHRWPVNSPYKEPVTWKMLPFDDVLIFIMPYLHKRLYHIWIWISLIISQDVNSLTSVDGYTLQVITHFNNCLGEFIQSSKSLNTLRKHRCEIQPQMYKKIMVMSHRFDCRVPVDIDYSYSMFKWSTVPWRKLREQG